MPNVRVLATDLEFPEGPVVKRGGCRLSMRVESMVIGS